MKQLLVFKFEGGALLMRLLMLIIASPWLWLVDVVNFGIDAAKATNKKKLAIKTVLLLLVILAMVQLIENACGELNELYFELLKITWLSLKIVSSSTFYVNTLILFTFIITVVIASKCFKTEALTISLSNSCLFDEIFGYVNLRRNLEYFQLKNDSTFFMASGMAKTTT